MTTTDLARMDRNAVAVLDTTNDALNRLGQWVTAAQQAHALVAPLVGTAFVPDAYRPKIDPRATDEQKADAYKLAVANATAAVLQGITLGIDPLMALQQIYIVHGRPGMYAKMMVALVQSRGHEVWTEDLTDTRAVVCGRRKGTQNPERVTITMDMARKAKWTSNAKYQETPQDMLWARAAARVCDRIASDVLKGVASVEEIQDAIQATAEVGAGTRTVTPRKAATSPMAAPKQVAAAAWSDDLLEEAAEEAASERPLDERQWRAINELLHKQGVTGPGKTAERLARIGGVVGRAISRGTDLNYDEGEAILATLRGETGETVQVSTDIDDEAALLDEAWPDVAEPGAS